MLKKTLAVILTITTLLALSACGLFLPEKTNEAVVTFDVSEFTETESEVETIVDTTDNAEKSKSDDISDKYIDMDEYFEPLLTEQELTMAVPYFLDEEQQMLYRKATNIYKHLWGRNSSLIEYEEALKSSIDKSNYLTFENENGRVYTISQGVYRNWDNFITLVESVFTREAFEEQNSDLYFVEHNGMLAFDSGIFRKPLSYNPNFADEFELVSKSENQIIFTVTGYYSIFDYKQNEPSLERKARYMEGWNEIKTFTICMTKTEDGWRFDEFHNTEVDVQEEFSLKDIDILGTYIWKYSSVEQALTDENPETLPRITFYEDGTCSMYFRLKEGACQFDGTYFVYKYGSVYISLDLDGNVFEGYAPDEFRFYKPTDENNITLMYPGFSSVGELEEFYRLSNEDLAKLNITIQDSDEVNEGVSPFVKGVDPLLTEVVLSKAVPDFLDEEQQILYRRAFSLLYYRTVPNYRSMDFADSLNYYIGQDNIITLNGDNSGMYTISQGRYQNWDDFIALLNSVFTEEHAVEFFGLNRTSSGYYNYYGKLAVIEASGIWSPYFSKNSKETFELISKTDSEIIFNIHFYHYSTYQDPDETIEESDARMEAGWEWIKTSPVRMINTENGWRFDHFCDATKEGDKFGPPLSKEDFELPVPGFLDFEQQLLYRRAHKAYSHLWGGSPRLIEYPEFLSYTIDASKYKTVEDENGRVYTLAQGYFRGWSDFNIGLTHKVFTEEEFNRQNADSIYIEHNGKLAFDNSVTREPSEYKICSKDEFELVSKNEDEIVFKVIGHYADADDAENKEVLTKEFTIRMVKTWFGWRFDEFHVASAEA